MDTDVNVPAAGADKRTSNRIRSFLRAQIIFNNRMTTIDCIVKNISPDGARVALSDTLAVPTEFDIYIPQHNRSHHARLVWRDKESIGIDFIDAHTPTATPQASAQPEMWTASNDRIRELEVQNSELKARVRALSKRLTDLGQDPDNTL